MSINLDPSNDSDDKEGEILAELNLTPLIDIMLVLLIIFMVTSTIALESGLDIDLPKTQGETKAKSSNAVIISLDSNAVVSVQGKKVDFENLSKVIKEGLAQEKTDEVIFEGDTKSTLGRMIEIMDIAKKSGAQKFAIATEVDQSLEK